jgi:UPF0716 family protein affecting phage T7 exclusion
VPLLALVALFIALPLAELYVILKVGDAIGAVWTILLLAADSVLGSLLLRAQGLPHNARIHHRHRWAAAAPAADAVRDPQRGRAPARQARRGR